MSHYIEDRKQPWGAVVVVIAILIFGGIIIAWFLGVFCPASGANCSSPSGTVAPPPTSSQDPSRVEIYLYSALTKQDWIDTVTNNFNAAQVKVASGKPIFVRVKHGTSGGSQQEILNGKEQPTAWSPGEQTWVDEANQTWTNRTGRPLVSEACRPTVYAPIGFGMWRPMAEAMGWPDKPISWDDIIALAADPQGWARYGHSEWRQFRFGHPHAVYSNVGLLMIAELAHSTLDSTGDLTPEQVKSSQVVEAVRHLELHTYHYGIQSRNLLDLTARRGPSYLHAVMTLEPEVLKANQEHAAILPFPFAFVFPAEGTFWTEQPYCVLDTDWVSDEQREAARLYGDYLLAPEQQALAIDNYVRPLDQTLPLHSPISLENGTDPRVTLKTVAPLPSPSGATAGAIKDVFIQTKKKATVIIVLDTSGSMQGEKMKNAAAATINFLKRLEKEDWVAVVPFNNQPAELQPAGRAADVVEDLSNKVGTLFPEGGTALYDAVCQAVERVSALRAADEAAGDKRLYGIVVLSDGQDTASQKTKNDMLNLCLPSGEDVEGVKVFTIAYGEDADKNLMTEVANHTNGKTFVGDPETIERVYNAISAEQ